MKQHKIWNRYNVDQAQLKLDCVDLLAKSYTELGQRPDKEQIVLMAQLLYQDLIQYYSNMTIDEVNFAFHTGIRNTEDGTSCFINVRQWNIWLKEHKKKANLKRQQKQITAFDQYKQTQKQISGTIKKAKQIK